MSESTLILSPEFSKEEKEPKPGSWILVNAEESDPRLGELLDDGFEPFNVQMVMKVNRITQQGEPGFIVFLKKQVKG
jgi:hypothetical protein